MFKGGNRMELRAQYPENWKWEVFAWNWTGRVCIER